MGVPSKYSIGFVDREDETLYRANRTTPQHTKNERIMQSYNPCNPIEKPRTAGATPNDIISANESSSRPNPDASFLILATQPSIISKNSPSGIRKIESNRNVWLFVVTYFKAEKMLVVPQTLFNSVIMSASSKLDLLLFFIEQVANEIFFSLI